MTHQSTDQAHRGRQEALPAATVTSPTQFKDLETQLLNFSEKLEKARAGIFLNKLLEFGHVPNFSEGKLSGVNTESYLPVTNPSTAEVIIDCPVTPIEQVDATIQFAKDAQINWGRLTVNERTDILIKAHQLFVQRRDAFAELIHIENGKTMPEAYGSIDRGIECLKYAMALPVLANGKTMEVSQGVTCQEDLRARGIVAGITPFNFPAMVPLWMAPLAIGTGNAFVLKPSEQTPLSALLLAETFSDAGLPPGIFNVVNGDKTVVNELCTHPLVDVVSFVGSSKIAQLVYQNATAHSKSVCALGGAKNHLILLPDADPTLAVKGIVNSSCGCAGQRCMAGSVLIAVGEVDHIVEQVKVAMANLRPGHELGPVISEAALKRIHGYLERAGEFNDAKVILDGRNVELPQVGYFIGASIIDGATGVHPAACEEIFGPVLTIIRCDTLNEACNIEKASPYGNASSIFTQSTQAVDYFQNNTSSAMLGVNVGVPVPREPFSFGGMGYSRFGSGDITGPDAISMYTTRVKRTSTWSGPTKPNWMS